MGGAAVRVDAGDEESVLGPGAVTATQPGPTEAR
jgi:hypothetical protein